MSQQFSWQSAITKSDLEGSTKLVLLVIGTYMNQHGDGAFPSYKTLAAGTSLNRATVIRHVEIAIAKGWLSKRNRVRLSEASGRLEADSNTYAISFPVVAQDDQVVAPCDHPGRTTQPPVVAQCDPNTPSLTPQGTQEPPVAPKGCKAGRRKRDKVTFAAFLAACSEAGEKPIRRDDPIFGFAEDIQLPRQFLLLAWRAFARRHTDSGRQQKDWRAHFRESVRGNWAKLWWCPEGRPCELTTAGIQLQRELEAEKARELEQAA